ncbi:hypothetical protein F2Q68_00004418 [Brassica cretica]|uniref:Uncharacterized protein n=2 Tax=Brassica cretica TaxID=69181 RepID=A0ABQ7CHD7_BRACR|nr:hypothetical protein F2Q68_00004418 [Brassica cretica]KAF3550942.1 hypothetical protein DY000_02006454 [Brassica cretica]
MKIEKNGISPFSSYDGSRVKEESSDRPWREYTRSSRREAQGENFFRANLALRAFRQLSVFVILSCDSTRFCSLTLLELGISPTALVAEAFTLL